MVNITKENYETNGIEVITDKLGALWLNERHVQQQLGHKSLPSILLYRSQDIQIFFFSATFPASEYLFSAPRGLKTSIISTRFCSLFSRYLEYLRN